jgi:hypothetical protein
VVSSQQQVVATAHHRDPTSSYKMQLLIRVVGR